MIAILPFVLLFALLVMLIVFYRQKKALIERCTLPVNATVVGVKEKYHSGNTQTGSRSYTEYIEQIHYAYGDEEYTVDGRRFKRESAAGPIGSIVQIKVNPQKYSEYVTSQDGQSPMLMLFGIGVIIFNMLFFLLIILLSSLAPK